MTPQHPSLTSTNNNRFELLRGPTPFRNNGPASVSNIRSKRPLIGPDLQVRAYIYIQLYHQAPKKNIEYGIQVKKIPKKENRNSKKATEVMVLQYASMYFAGCINIHSLFQAKFPQENLGQQAGQIGSPSNTLVPKSATCFKGRKRHYIMASNLPPPLTSPPQK